MAFFAIGEDDSVSAWDAEQGGAYWCLECLAPVKVRRGKNRFPHFYHLSSSPSCRLYSKSEDHLLLQLQLQKQLPEGNTRMEQPIPSINRVSDLLWEKEKIAFEIQCSAIGEAEAQARGREYKTAGYDVVWILDDRIFNKRQLRPSEEFLRCRLCYFASFRRSAFSLFYDQFEIFQDHRRIKKGGKVPVDFRNVHPLLPHRWPAELPSQIEKRIPNCSRYFDGDLLHRALLSPCVPSLARSLQNWRYLEIQLRKENEKTGVWKRFFHRWVYDPYAALLSALLRRMN